MCDTDTTGCYTGATTTTFTFGPKGENALTVQHNLLTKVPEIKATPSCKTFHAYASNVDQQAHTYKLETYCSSPCPMPSTTPTHDNIPAVISDDEDDDTAPQVQPTSQSEGRSGHDSDASSESLFQHNDDDAWDNLL